MLRIKKYFNRAITQLIFSCVLGFSSTILSASQNTDSTDKNTSNDLYYKEILFHFYQNDYFTALTHELAANQQGRLDSNKELIEHGLKLSFGIINNAAMPLPRLLDISSTKESDQNRLWFYFGKIYHQRGYKKLANQAFNNISMPLLDPVLEAERQLYMQKILIQQGNEKEMFALMKTIKPESKVTQYIDYNLAMAYLDEKETAKAMRILLLIVKNNTDDESLYIADKARLALARLALQNHLYGEATLHLDRIQKNSFFYAEAMALKSLGHLERGDLRLSSIVWDQLIALPDLDPKSLKVLFSVPYFWFKKNDETLARSGFEKTVARVAVEKKRLQIIRSNLNTSWLDQLLKKTSNKSMGWFWMLDSTYAGSENLFLRQKLNSHRMHDALSNYHDLNILESNLLQWKNTLPIYAAMLEQRQALFVKNAAAVNATVSQIDKNSFFNQLQNYRKHINSVEKNTDVLALLRTNEKKQWDKLRRIKQQTEKEPHSPLKREADMLQGVFLWQQYQAFHERLWKAKKELKDTENQILINQALFKNLSDIEYKSVQSLIQFASEIKSDQTKINQLLAQVTRQKKQWSHFIIRNLKREIDKQIKILDRYAGDAEFGLVYLDEQVLKSLTESAQ